MQATKVQTGKSGFSPEQIALHESIRRAKADPEWQLMIRKVAWRDTVARVLCRSIRRILPEDMTGIVMINADTGEWFNAMNKDEGWKEAKKQWGENIAHPPVWTITLTQEEEYIPPPEIFRK